MEKPKGEEGVFEGGGRREKAQDKDLNLVTVSLFWKVRERAQRGRRGSATPETA